jgi:hypothetical protein
MHGLYVLDCRTVVELSTQISCQSGVTYDILGKTDYDANADQCLRINDAWPIQANDNKSRVPTGKQTDFHFSACAGANLSNMADTAFMGYIQMDRAATPDLVTMQAGGGDAGFWNVVNNCLSHEQNQNYGPDWPDPNPMASVQRPLWAAVCASTCRSRALL